MLLQSLWLTLVTAGALLLGSGVLHLIPRLGSTGRGISAWLCQAPALDLLITYFTILPMIVGPIIGGWAGLAAAIIGQLLALIIWEILHTLAHPTARRGPRLVRTMNRTVGPVRNYAAVWITAIAVPCFWIVRLAQWLLYPPLTWLVRLPRYNHAEWVNVSRHKFDGLVGHDLIWCLYCDWMTGIWSLGAEMLRNVESFWCPIRFHSDKKCANCAIDFPDVNNGWVAANGSMADVTQTWSDKYSPAAKPSAASNSWFGHPARLTIEGQQMPRSTDD